MPRPTPEQNAAFRERLAHLAAGELSPLASWRLRQQIARDPALARDWEATRQLWADLKTLQTLDARPAWQAIRSEASASDHPARSRKPLLTLPAMAASVVFLAASGAVTARHLMSQDAEVKVERPDWRVETRVGGQSTLRGEVKVYDTHGNLLGTHLSPGDWDTPVLQNRSKVWANVVIGGEAVSPRGVGRHVLRATDRNNTLLGSAVIVAQTPVEYALAHPPVGTRASPGDKHAADGWGRTFGVVFWYGKRMDWRFQGVGKVRFRLDQTGQTLQYGRAKPINDAERARLREVLSSKQFMARVSPSNVSGALLELTIDGKTTRCRGYGTFPVDGMGITIEVTPVHSKP